jgi:hypothetical protein
MSNEYAVTYNGQITLRTTRGQIAAACPTCRTTRGLTVYGRLGEPGRLRCNCGRRFDYPNGFDAYEGLRQAVRDFHSNRSAPRRSTRSIGRAR